VGIGFICRAIAVVLSTTLPGGSDLLDGTPRWSYVFGIMMQTSYVPHPPSQKTAPNAMSLPRRNEWLLLYRSVPEVQFGAHHRGAHPNQHTIKTGTGMPNASPTAPPLHRMGGPLFARANDGTRITGRPHLRTSRVS